MHTRILNFGWSARASDRLLLLNLLVAQFRSDCAGGGIRKIELRRRYRARRVPFQFISVAALLAQTSRCGRVGGRRTGRYRT